jgi:N-dimethylarginine dimethylaminohydrolase
MPKKRVLMCAPTYFDVSYSINPWMHLEAQPDPERTKAEWFVLNADYEKFGIAIELIKPIKGLPDMVFTANGGLVIDGKVMLARFRYRQRQPETEHFRKWFEQAGYKDIRLPEHDFEGEGDALVCGDLILAGHGFRSDERSHQELAKYFKKDVVSLKLVDPRFYHLDTCLSVLNDTTIMFYPAAFDAMSEDRIRQSVPNIIEAEPDDALAFGLNAVSDGKNVMMSHRAEGLMEQLRLTGFNPVPVDITEFKKSGGGVKCLTLELRS